MKLFRSLLLGAAAALTGCATTSDPRAIPTTYYAFAADGRDSRAVFSRDPDVDIVKDFDHLELSLVRTTASHLDELVARGIVERYAPSRIRLSPRREAPEYAGIVADGTKLPGGYGEQWAYARIKADAARKQGINGRTVVIADLDSGIYADHEAFELNTIRFHDFVRYRSEPYDNDSHGTWTAGIIAHMLPRATLIADKCLDKDGASALPPLLEAFDQVIADNPDVVNMSIGFLMEQEPAGAAAGALDDIIPAALERIHKKGILMVAATGNEKYLADRGRPASWPARSPYVIAVGGFNRANEMLSVSNLGADVYAPGISVYGPDSHGMHAYDLGDGTSGSAPLVTAAIAALCERHGHRCTLTEVRKLLAERSDTETSIVVANGKRETVELRMLNLERLLAPEAKADK